jgi:hypothetical protein
MAVITFKSLAEVPEDLRVTARENAAGIYEVNVVPNDRIKEFRDNNVKLSQERDDLLGRMTRYETVTGVPVSDIAKLEEFSKSLEELRATRKRVEDGILVENTSLDEAAAARVREVQEGLRGQLSEMARERDAHKTRASSAETRVNQMMVESLIRAAARDPDIGMLDNAVNLILPRAFETFRIEDDGMVAKNREGAIIYGTDGVSPMSAKEWLMKEREVNDFLFKGSRGGGAAGGESSKTGRMSVAELAKMSPQARMDYARKNGLM